MSCSPRRGWRKCRTLWTGGCRWTGANSSPCTGCGSNASTARVQFSPLRPRTEPEERNLPEFDLPSTKPGAEMFYCRRVKPKGLCCDCDEGNATVEAWHRLSCRRVDGLVFYGVGCVPREARATISHFVLMSSVIWERAGYPENKCLDSARGRF